MHICISKLTISCSDNGMSPDQCQAITWTNAEILLIGPLGTNFSEILIEIYTFWYKKMHLKMLSRKWQPFCFGLKVLMSLKLCRMIFNRDSVRIWMFSWTYWGRVTHICVGKLRQHYILYSLFLVQCQAIIWISTGALSIGPLGIHVSEISMKIQTFSFKKHVSKCCLQNVGHFVSASMCWRNASAD